MLIALSKHVVMFYGFCWFEGDKRRFFSLVAKPTENIPVDTTPAAPLQFMPDALPVATLIGTSGPRRGIILIFAQ